MADEEVVDAAVQTYIYGYPLVYNVDEMAKAVAGSPLVGKAVPFNTFGSVRALLGPEAAFVSPNNDTLYTLGPCDLSGGPVVVHVPDTAGRYYVLQFVDAWTNNFAYVGHRSTGTAETDFLLLPPGYDGSPPDGMAVIQAPTTAIVIVGRVAVDGPADLPAVHALQDQFAISALTPSDEPLAGLPSPAEDVDDDLLFWEKLRVALNAFPPSAADAEYVEAAARFALTAPYSPFETPDPAVAEILTEAEAKAKASIEELSRTQIQMVDGWASALHAFDYNLDHFSLGTMDTDEWKIADRTTAYVTRAVAARMGLWGNHGYEADYEILWADEHGDPFDGTHRYELRLPEPPVVGAFWSLTMYDEPKYYLVANPIDRYSIGDRTPGLVYEPDGGLTIYLQQDSPGPDHEANWLPAPAGAFRPILRAYEPGPAIQSGQYRLPAVRRVD